MITQYESIKLSDRLIAACGDTSISPARDSVNIVLHDGNKNSLYFVTTENNKQYSIINVNKKTNIETVIIHGRDYSDCYLGKEITITCDYAQSTNYTSTWCNHNFIVLLVNVYFIWDKLVKHNVHMKLIASNTISFYQIDQHTNKEMIILTVQSGNYGHKIKETVSPISLRTLLDNQKSLAHEVLLILLSRIKTYTQFYICDASKDCDNIYTKQHINISGMIRDIHKQYPTNTLNIIKNKNLVVKKNEVGLNVTTDYMTTNKLINLYRSIIIPDLINKHLQYSSTINNSIFIGKYVYRNLSNFHIDDLICKIEDHDLLNYDNPQYTDSINMIRSEGITIITICNNVICVRVPSQKLWMWLQLLTSNNIIKTNITTLLSTPPIKYLLNKNMVSPEINEYLQLDQEP